MTIGSIAAVVIVLVVFFIFSQIWFHSVEAILTVFSCLFHKKAKPDAWHPFPDNQDDQME